MKLTEAETQSLREALKAGQFNPEYNARMRKLRDEVEERCGLDRTKTVELIAGVEFDIVTGWIE